METKNISNRLPPLASLDESPEEGMAQTTTRPALVKLNDEEFARALKGDVSFEGTLKVHKGSTRAAATGRAVTELSEPALETYTEAAALRYTYRLDALTPVVAVTPHLAISPRHYKELSREEREQIFTYLTARSEIVSDARGNTRWMLRDEVRRAALQRLIEKGNLQRGVRQARADCAEELREASELLKAQESDDPSLESSEELAASRVEETLWEFLSKPQISLEYDRRQLLINQRVVEWVFGLPGVTVPSPEDVKYQLAKETLLQPFRHLTGEWKDGKFVSTFKGREEELSRIYDYLSVLPPHSWRARLQRFVRRLSDTTWGLVNRTAGHRPLLIHGLGGVGKSTLMAKILLDHLTETDPKDRFPYAYLDCDLSSLSVLEPLTLLAEAGRQLATQYPASEPAWNAARNLWLGKATVGSPYRVDPASRVDAINEFTVLLLESEAGGVRVSNQIKRGLPFLLVLDTFEEVQYRDRDGIKDVFRLLNIMRSRIPNLHIIMMGRAPLGDIKEEIAHIESIAIEGDAFGTGAVTDFSVIEVELGDLEESKASEYLQDQGISDPELAEELVSIVGGNPLGLRLMVNVFKKGDLDLTSLRQETEWQPSWGAWFRGRIVPPKALLQGVLFDRILGHIHDKKIKKLAHPGLVLRRITPDLIKDVLAEPCGLGQIDDAQASSYFEQLAHEVSLVGTERDPTSNELIIRHRPEIRKIMLRLMDADEEMRDRIHKVHENAIEFYEKEGQQDLEEALYHRLMIGKTVRESDYLEDIPTGEAIDAGYAVAPERELIPVWLRLSNSSAELPLSGKAYLAARLNADTITDEDWEKVDPQDWELSILSRCSHRARVRQSVISALEGLRRLRERLVSLGDALRPRSPLTLMEAVLLERLGLYAEVQKLANVAIARLIDKDADRRVMQHALVMARSYAQAEERRSCDESIKLARRRLDRLAKGPTANVQRYSRMFLRFAADCHALTQSDVIFKEIMDLLSCVADKNELKDCGTLARCVVSTIAVSEDLSQQDYEQSLELVQSESLLPILLRGMPADTSERVSGVLERWSTQAVAGGADEKELKKLIRLAGGKKKSGLPEQISELPRQFKKTPLSRELLYELSRAFTPAPVSDNAGESVLDEARRNSDLMPGEGNPSPKPLSL
jgi:hypothetical protein